MKRVETFEGKNEQGRHGNVWTASTKSEGYNTGPFIDMATEITFTLSHSRIRRRQMHTVYTLQHLFSPHPYPHGPHPGQDPSGRFTLAFN